jgi:hypothetical protein
MRVINKHYLAMLKNSCKTQLHLKQGVEYNSLEKYDKKKKRQKERMQIRIDGRN